MTTELTVVRQLHKTADLPERDRGAAEAEAARLRDAKAGNTCRAYRCAWQQFRTWAEAGGHPALPRCPRRPWPSTWATWPQPAGPSPPFSRPARPAPTFHAAASSPLSRSRNLSRIINLLEIRPQRQK